MIHSRRLRMRATCARTATRVRSALPLPYCSLARQFQAKTERAFRSAFATYARATLPEDVAQALWVEVPTRWPAATTPPPGTYLAPPTSMSLSETAEWACVVPPPAPRSTTSTATARARPTSGCCATPATLGSLCRTAAMRRACRTSRSTRSSRPSPLRLTVLRRRGRGTCRTG